MARQYSDLRGIVASALQPTEVTGLDMEMAALGTYIDKWDESARRLEAIAARGFAELKAHPDWAAALKIPEGVLSGSEEALKGWARRTANDVRNLFRPDLLDIDAAADAVEEYMREMAAREVTIDLVIKELQTRGVSEEQARKQVLEMYGLEQELPISLGLAPGAVESLIGGIGTVTLPVELAEATAALPGEEGAPPSLGLVEGALSSVEDQAGDLYGAGERAARHLSDGFTVTMAGLAFGGPLLSHLEGEMKAQQESLAEIGGSLWITIERGFRHGMQRSSLLREFVEEVLSLVLQRLARSETFGGGSGTP